MLTLVGPHGTRTDGERIRSRITAALEADPSLTLSLDFSHVTAITQGWADEAIAKLAPDQLHRIRIIHASDANQAIIRFAVSLRHSEDTQG